MPHGPGQYDKTKQKSYDWDGDATGMGKSPNSRENLRGQKAKPQLVNLIDIDRVTVPKGNEKVNSRPHDLSSAEIGTQR